MPIVRLIMQNPWALGFMSLCLVFVPIVGMSLVHKYGWQYWEPFDKRHEQGYNNYNGHQHSLVARSVWDGKVEGSNPSCPTLIHTLIMDYYSVEHWQEHWDELLERVENGEIVGIIGEDGNKAVMVPADDEILKLYTELNNEAQ